MNDILNIFDSLTNKKKVFQPSNLKNIRVYACGPTVYSYAHIGNARMAVVCDVLIRVLRNIYPKVTYISNITDIDDKIIQESKRTQLSTNQLTEKFFHIYNQDMDSIGVNRPDMQPKATDFIEQIINTIKLLIQNGSAYVAENHVLFNVLSYKYYGSLSKRSFEEQIAGNRVDIAPFKKSSADFVLWKPSKEDEPAWDSPWGKGRPGWHIECSVMSQETLGLPFDIHGGGSDLRFPHHENEIAQSCSLGKRNQKPENFARYWFHNGFVMVNGEKMSKSLKNIILVHNLIKKYSGSTIRLALLSSHYRQPLNWTEKTLYQAKVNISKFYKCFQNHPTFNGDKEEFDEITMELKKVILDDFNTPKAFAILNKLLKDSKNNNQKSVRILMGNLKLAQKYLGVFFENKTKQQNNKISTEKIEKLLEKRQYERSKKNYKKADEIRKLLETLGIGIEDTESKTKWFEIEQK